MPARSTTKRKATVASNRGSWQRRYGGACSACSLRRRQRVFVKSATSMGAMLQGILYCGACGRRMSHTFTCRGERRYRYYVCRGSTCGDQSITAAAFEASVIEQLRNVMRRNHGEKLREFLKTLTVQPQPAPEMLTRLRALVDRVTYDHRSGEVL